MADSLQVTPVVEPLTVAVSRIPFEDWVTVTMPGSAQSWQLDPEECREWFRIRGADMDAVEKATDYLYSGFPAVTITIRNPRNLAKVLTRKDPLI